MTVNRYCASGITALQMAADRIRIGEAEVMIAGGVESMSMVPMGGNKPSFSPEIFARDENIGLAYGMGLTAEKVAQQWKISREAQDEFALRIAPRALAAIEAGHFRDEMTPFELIERSPNLLDGSVNTKKRIVDIDEGPRRDTSLEGLAKLRAVFAAKGSVTAGNSSQTSDGAGALIVASEAAVKRFGLTPLARFVSFAVRGVPPEIMGIGPIEAIPAALKLAGISASDLGWIELNEAFAAQSLAVLNDLDSKGIVLDRAKVNPNGGAIALGHPLGATGAIRAASVIHGLRRTGAKYGMVTMCVGAGQGAAGILERVERPAQCPAPRGRSALGRPGGRWLLGTCSRPVRLPCRRLDRLPGRAEKLRHLASCPRVGAGIVVHATPAAQHVERARRCCSMRRKASSFRCRAFPIRSRPGSRATLGTTAFAFFNARGAMSHSLDEPIPGAPVLDATQA